IFASFRRLGKGGVDQSAAPVDLVSAIQFGQQHRMQLHPHAGLVPSLQVVSAGLAATEAQFRRQVVPSDTRLEDEQNTGEDLAVIQGLASWKAKTTLGRRRQQRFETIPQRIGNKHSHGTPPRVLKTPSPGPEQLRACQTIQNSSFFPIALSRKGTLVHQPPRSRATLTPRRRSRRGYRRVFFCHRPHSAILHAAPPTPDE